MHFLKTEYGVTERLGLRRSSIFSPKIKREMSLGQSLGVFKLGQARAILKVDFLVQCEN